MDRLPVFFHENQLLSYSPVEWDARGLLPHPETPERAQSILQALGQAPEDYEIIAPERIPLKWIEAVHTPGLLQILQASEALPEGEVRHITRFPKRNQENPEPGNLMHAGFFCFDTSTPLTRHTWASAAWSAASAVAAAEWLAAGHGPIAYALCRPPGHHADSAYFGGYCYLNNTAIAAEALKPIGRVAVLDVDYHHGDGTQSIFYRDGAVLTTSLHADPAQHYPYYSGLPEETGLGAGAGLNVNVPLPAGTTIETFLNALEERILPAIEAFDPAFLLVSLGLDTYRHDPLANFCLDTPDYTTLGQRLGRLPYPVLVLQEGGYHVADLGRNVQAFLDGLRQGKMAIATCGKPQAAMDV